MGINNDVSYTELLEFAPPVADGSDPVTGAKHALIAAKALVSGYTRGNDVNSFDEYRPGVREVILTVAARILANPGGVSVRVTAGGVTVSRGAGFSGYTLAEQAVLNRYRKRAVGP